MASKDTTVTVNIVGADRIGCSVNGNPTWLIHTEDGETYRTMSDASCSYSVSNYVPHYRDNYRPTPAVLTLTPFGRVRYLKRPDGTNA